MTLLPLLLSAVLASNLPGPQAPPPRLPADPTVYAASYVEVMPSARATAIAALKQYREASRKQDGYGRLDLFEQIGWPGHFAIFESWRDQKAFDAHNAAAQKALLDALQPIRVSGFDQRPYKTLTVAPAPSGGGQRVDLRRLTRRRVAGPAGAGDAQATGRGEPPGGRQPPVRRRPAHDAREPFHRHRNLAEPEGARRPRRRRAHQTVSR